MKQGLLLALALVICSVYCDNFYDQALKKVLFADYDASSLPNDGVT